MAQVFEGYAHNAVSTIVSSKVKLENLLVLDNRTNSCKILQQLHSGKIVLKLLLKKVYFTHIVKEWAAEEFEGKVRATGSLKHVCCF